MISKRWHVRGLLFVFAFFYFGTASADTNWVEASLMDTVINGTPPPPMVLQWFRLISMAPNPPGGPKFYFMQTYANRPALESATFYVQMTAKRYAVLLRAAQSFGCDRNLRVPKKNAKFSELPAIRISIHGGGATREICQVSYGKVCAYLNSVENLTGESWPKDIHEDIAILRKASNC